jgi:hypothetical protein
LAANLFLIKNEFIKLPLSAIDVKSLEFAYKFFGGFWRFRDLVANFLCIE